VPTVPTYYTIATAPFFPGLVALLNSLRLSGNKGELVVLDRGLSDAQRRRLEPHARLVQLPVEAASRPELLKPFPRMLEPEGVIVLVDSDMLVVRSLEWVAERAEAGAICLFPDPIPDRWFAEWEQILALRRPLRRRPYLNSGFVALSVERWPGMLDRWWELCAAIPPDQPRTSQEAPFWAADQDALNAYLSSELPDDAVEQLPAGGEAYPEEALQVRVVDARTLACELDGEPVSVLHHSLGPKVWQPYGWVRLREDAYVQLLPRVLFGEDVPLRLDPAEVPFRLRPGRGPDAARTALDTVHGGLRGAVNAMPPAVRERLVAARNRLLHPLGG
jgi:hypothetical protein